MSRHRLTKIDREARTALCSVCGPTEIRLSQPRTEKPPEARCVQRVGEERQYMRNWQRKRRKRTGRPHHALREINVEQRTAVCAICGPTDVYQSKSKGKIFYRCANPVREFERQQRGAHIVNPYAKIHILSEINEESHTAICAKCGPVEIEWNHDPYLAAIPLGAAPGSPKTDSPQVLENIRIVFEYKRRHACKRCSSMAILNPDGFKFFEVHLPKEQRVWVLVKKAMPEEMIAELEKRDMYCEKCLRLVVRAFVNNTPVPEFRPFTTHYH